MEFTPVRKVSAYELIVEQIERGVRSGELAAGDRLPSERTLMETFGVSRSSVREALRVLQATGVVDARPGDPRGSVVLAYSADVLRRPLTKLVRQESITRVELLQYRLMIEGQAALLAAARHSEEDLERIDERARGIAELTEIRPVDLNEFGRRVNLLHEAVNKAAGNSLIATSGLAVHAVLAELAAQRLAAEVDDEERLERVRRSAADAATLAQRIREGDPLGAQRAATANIYRYYRDRLTEQERAALEPMVTGEA